MNRHLFIEDITPTVDGGQYPIKRVVGDALRIEADIFRDGHDKICAVVQYVEPPPDATFAQQEHYFKTPCTTPLKFLENDRFQAEVLLTRNGPFWFRVVAWTDLYETWLVELSKKVTAGLAVPSEALEGALLCDEAAAHAQGGHRKILTEAHANLHSVKDQPQQVLAIASDPALALAVHHALPRHDAVHSPVMRVTVDRARAQFGAWYELFPRSQGKTPKVGSTFREAQERLPELRDLGFDVVYLPPVHPIGVSFRKGPNNSLTCGPNDPGCPWAIGGAEGGHTAIEPGLGTIEDFDAYVAAAAAHDLEIALDYAIQCSPDHPWVKAHPNWFHHRPDGTIKYAENPPKKYQDVYTVNFDTKDKEQLWQALVDVLFFWIDHGVKIFRVDNPHTKAFDFWHWAIAQVQGRHPEVIFLSEAFTRPKVMKLLAKVGFTQSYTYFTWRNTRAELTEYLKELTTSGMQDYFRPNFFANTPDILPEILQTGGRPAFSMRLVLAATLAPTYGIYSGFELCESAAMPHSEEYLDSEKYEVRVRDWNQPGNIKDLVQKLNRIRRDNPALQKLANIKFFSTDNDQLLFYGKKEGNNTLLIVVNLDPHHAHHGTVFVPMDYLGYTQNTRCEVVDLLTGAHFNWGPMNYVRLDPTMVPAHILLVKGAL